MKILGKPRKPTNDSFWEDLMVSLYKGLEVLIAIAGKRRRNYILDHANFVYGHRQSEIMSLFQGFQRFAVVFVCQSEQHDKRLRKRLDSEGREFSVDTISNMKRNFSIPLEREKLFNSIVFTDLQSRRARQLVDKVKKQATGNGSRGNSSGFYARIPSLFDSLGNGYAYSNVWDFNRASWNYSYYNGGRNFF